MLFKRHLTDGPPPSPLPFHQRLRLPWGRSGRAKFHLSSFLRDLVVALDFQRNQIVALYGCMKEEQDKAAKEARKSAVAKERCMRYISLFLRCTQLARAGARYCRTSLMCSGKVRSFSRLFCLEIWSLKMRMPNYNICSMNDVPLILFQRPLQVLFPAPTSKV